MVEVKLQLSIRILKAHGFAVKSSKELIEGLRVRYCQIPIVFDNLGVFVEFAVDGLEVLNNLRGSLKDLWTSLTTSW